ncbi:MAG: uroporphyrinogen-III synthase [Actinomycetota bacterium]|nr:uroporphyrinogen-III synthase [Actinomycetota bacterium]
MHTNPLSGFVVGVTADRRSEEQIRLLEHRGAECQHGAVIKTHPLGPTEALEQATRAVVERRPDIVLLMTGIGVRGWLEAADALHLGDQLRAALEHADLYVRGPKAMGAAITGGLTVAWAAPDAQSEGMVAELERVGVEGRLVAVQLDGTDGEDLAAAVGALGADVVTVPVYRWSLPDDLGPAERLIRSICERKVDAVTFTAKPAIENFMTIAAEIGRLDDVRRSLNEDVVTVCVGPVCSAGAVEQGIRAPIQPDRARLGPMVQCLTHEFTGRNAELELAGRNVSVQGRMVTVDGREPVRLTERERGVLRTLAARPGVVVSKQSLLSEVWGGAESDVHVVEVTVARLRQRLGDAGAGVETVVRRGYRLSPT